MIVVGHGCGWIGSILEWERVPVAYTVIPAPGITADVRRCPGCHSHITAASLRYTGETTVDAELAKAGQ